MSRGAPCFSPFSTSQRTIARRIKKRRPIFRGRDLAIVDLVVLVTQNGLLFNSTLVKETNCSDPHYYPLLVRRGSTRLPPASHPRAAVVYVRCPSLLFLPLLPLSTSPMDFSAKGSNNVLPPPHNTLCPSSLPLALFPLPQVPQPHHTFLPRYLEGRSVITRLLCSSVNLSPSVPIGQVPPMLRGVAGTSLP